MWFLSLLLFANDGYNHLQPQRSTLSLQLLDSLRSLSTPDYKGQGDMLRELLRWRDVNFTLRIIITA